MLNIIRDIVIYGTYTVGACVIVYWLVMLLLVGVKIWCREVYGRVRDLIATMKFYSRDYQKKL